MSPFAQIEAAYAKRPQEEPFANYVDWHLRHGFVFSRPDFFCMGRAVSRKAPPKAIRDPLHDWHGTERDAWFIHAASGNCAKMWEVLPYPLGWVCWTRLHDPLGELTIVDTERLRRLCPPDLSRLE